MESTKIIVELFDSAYKSHPGMIEEVRRYKDIYGEKVAYTAAVNLEILSPAARFLAEARGEGAKNRGGSATLGDDYNVWVELPPAWDYLSEEWRLESDKKPTLRPFEYDVILESDKTPERYFERMARQLRPGPGRKPQDIPQALVWRDKRLELVWDNAAEKI